MDLQQFMDRSSSIGSDNRVIATSGWEDELGQGSDELFFVSTYSDFDKLGETHEMFLRYDGRYK